MNSGWWLILSVVSVAGVPERPVVRSNFGPLRGKWLKSLGNASIAAYLGIPYAQAPVGPLRFKSPKPWEQHWVRTRNAAKDGPICLQLDKLEERVIGSEDCLTLNVFVPEILPKRLLAVLVFVHGGSFAIGSKNSSLYAPDYLLDQEIILVTVNYRLGILGFLSTGNEASPGNYGLKDIFEALKWIQANIEAFGGDASSVTLAGHSSGAALVHHLALSKRTKGLFDKLITHSGVATAPWAIHSIFNAKIRYITLAIQLGCTTNRKIVDLDYPADELLTHQSIVEEDTQIVQCIAKAPAQEVAGLIKYFRVWRDEHPYVNFGPTVEPEHEDALITKHPMSTIEDEEFRDIPWITGIVSDEGLLKSIPIILDQEKFKEFKEDFPSAIPFFLEMEEVVTNTSVFARSLAQFYIEKIPPNDTLALENALTTMAGDGLITYWVFDALREQSARMNSSVFFYEFSYKGTFTSTFRYKVPKRFGIYHGDELNYLFPILNQVFVDWDLQNTANDLTMIHIMTEMYSSFIKNGIPSARLTPEWKPYQEDFRFMRLGMELSTDISMQSDFLPGRMDFWRNLMANVSTPRDQLMQTNGKNPDELQNNATALFNSNSANSTLLLSLRFTLGLVVLHLIF